LHGLGEWSPFPCIHSFHRLVAISRTPANFFVRAVIWHRSQNELFVIGKAFNNARDRDWGR
jgi:hypothetical protein